MKPQKMSNKHNARHLYVGLYLGKGRRMRRGVHQLVALTYLDPKPTTEHEVNHINGDPTDNRSTNLEWLTRAENEAHAVVNRLKASGKRHGRSTKPERTARGTRHGRSKITEDIVREIRTFREEGVTEPVLAERFGISRSLVGQIGRCEIWKHVINWRRATPLIME